MTKQGNVFQTEEQDRFLKTNLNEIEISDLPDREFKIMIKILTAIRIAMKEQSVSFNKKMGNIKNYQIEITELKYTIT